MRKFFRDESGVSTIEYLIGASVLAAIGGYLLSVLMPSVYQVEESSSETIYADYYRIEQE
ncbi:MAG TPA: hypothetical protein V6C99_04275 [Oculatellaceae cyanobacterium]